MATFGSTANSGNSNNYTSTTDRVVLSSGVPASSGVVESLTARIWIASGTRNVRGVIYTDSGGSPSSLVAYTDQVTISNTTEQAITFDFTGAQQAYIASGSTYWLGIHHVGSTTAFTYSMGGTGSAIRLANDTYADGPAATYVSSGSNTGPLDAYVTYNTVSGIDTLIEDFSDATYDTAKWSVSSSGATGSQASGQLVIDLPSAGSNGHYSYESIQGYDLTNNEIAIKLVQAASAVGDNTSYMILKSGITGGNWLSIGTETISGTRELKFKRWTGGSLSTTSAAYNPATHVWLRIRETAGEIYWETADASFNWTQHRTITTPWTVGFMEVTVGGEKSSNTGTPDDIIFDDLNILDHVGEISGTLELSGTIEAFKVNGREASGTLLLSGTAVGTRISATRIAERKTYIYKIYDEDDNFLGVWDDVMSEFNYSQEINNAGVTINIELARNSDSLINQTSDLTTTAGVDILTDLDIPITLNLTTINAIGPGSNVQFNYRVDVFVFYGGIAQLLDSDGAVVLDSDSAEILTNYGSPLGNRKFTGFISDINSRYGSEETTIVGLTSYGYDLDHHLVHSGSATTVPFYSYDPSDIVREGMDAFVVDGGLINYSSTTVENTHTVVTYTFKVNTYLELLKKSLELAPSDWFFYVGLGDNEVRFKPRPSTPAHYFKLGKDLQSLDLSGSILDVVNDVVFSGGEVTPGVNLFLRTTETPAANTRRGLERYSDNRVTLTDSAQIISESAIEQNNLIKYSTRLSILDVSYDIEAIELGQLIGFRNFNNYIDDLEMMIVGLTYYPDKVDLTLNTLLPSVPKRLEDIKRNLALQETQDNPDTPS